MPSAFFLSRVFDDDFFVQTFAAKLMLYNSVTTGMIIGRRRVVL